MAAARDAMVTRSTFVRRFATLPARSFARAAAAVFVVALVLTGHAAERVHEPLVADAGGLQIGLRVLASGVLFLYADEHGDSRAHPTTGLGDPHHVLVVVSSPAGPLDKAEVRVGAFAIGGAADGGREERRLSAMRVDGQLAYGAPFRLLRDQRYRIEVTVNAPGASFPVTASFDYLHRL